MGVRLFGAAVFVVAALYAWVGRTYAAPFGDPLGPSVFPVIVGLPAMLLAASLVVLPTGEEAWPSPARVVRQIAGLGVLVAYALLLRPLGFPIASVGLIAGLALLLGGPVLPALMVAGAMSLGLWVLFDQVLGLPLALLGTWFG